MKRVMTVLVMMILMLVLALPAMAQDTTPDLPADAVLLPGWLLGLVGIVVTAVLAGLLLVLNKALIGLKESYPAGTVEQVTRAVGDGLERILTQLRETAPTTPTNIDDFLLTITEPLTKAIIERLRGEGVAASTPPESQKYGATLGAMHAVEEHLRGDG